LSGLKEAHQGIPDARQHMYSTTTLLCIAQSRGCARRSVPTRVVAASRFFNPPSAIGLISRGSWADELQKIFRGRGSFPARFAL
jgi:hypothetical protein